MKSLPIRSDPHLAPIEKELALGLLGGSEFFDVGTCHPTAIRGLLAQPEFEVEALETKIISGKECIVGLRGRLPIGCLKIGRCRRDARLSRVFSRRGGRADYPALRSYDADQDRQPGADA